MVHRRLGEWHATTNVPKTVADLGNISKFNVPDAAQLGQLLLSLEKEIIELQTAGAAQSKDVSALESSLLRGLSLSLRW